MSLHPDFTLRRSAGTAVAVVGTALHRARPESAAEQAQFADAADGPACIRRGPAVAAAVAVVELLGGPVAAVVAVRSCTWAEGPQR